MTNTESATRTHVIEALAKNGWEKDRLLDAFSKTFETAITPTKASVWLRFEQGFNRWWLCQADFTSAGENVLAASSATIPEGADMDAVMRKVDTLIGEMELRILGAYSMRRMSQPHPMVTRWMHPYLTGRSFVFALALSEDLDAPSFVAIGDPADPDHVGIQVSSTPELYADVRGVLDRDAFVRDIRPSDPLVISEIPRATVELHAGASGLKPPYRGHPEIRLARSATRATFPAGISEAISRAQASTQIIETSLPRLQP